MSKRNREFDLEGRLIDFTVRIIRTAETLPKTKIGNHGPKGQNFMIRNSLFDIRYSLKKF
ncbi:MAG: hypothetical protein A2521_10830 [Deltaproteobacteria bacterium RIFOXYD12_FULL_57_12]|nr:MAG: hypothetical protein A2521_10830 [Deltaproteobacteria bacterium RIFOXYD12_FULL_57_12]